MSCQATEQFFENLPLMTQFSDVLRLENYQALPDDWWLVITDVQGSTQAIEAGRYREINSLGGCTVAAVLNAVKPLTIPYVFGGDGAGFCVPPDHVASVSEALKGCKYLAQEYFGLTLRTGLVPYKEIQAQAPVYVGRFSKSHDLQQAMFAGEGMQMAERLVKQETGWEVPWDGQAAAADFSGFECRWQQIPSPKEITVSLLVEAQSSELKERMQVYQSLVAAMQDFLGTEQHQQPIAAQGMKLAFDAGKLAPEARVKSYMSQGKSRKQALWKIRFENLLGELLMRLKLRTGKAQWGGYKQDAVISSDYRKFDGMFRCIFAAERHPFSLFTEWLDAQESKGLLFYGQHISQAAQLTCLVSETGVRHIHFVDGCDGGYAMAAADLKAKQSRLC